MPQSQVFMSKCFALPRVCRQTLIEPDTTKPTLKAWQLYQEARVRHQNRQAALAHLHSRTQSSSNSSSESSPVRSGTPSETKSKKSSKLGSPRFRRKYAAEWKKSLSECSPETANFFRLHAGLFFVQKKISGAVNISIEVNDTVQLRKIKHPEIERAFSKGFKGKANVMFRVSSQAS